MLRSLVLGRSTALFGMAVLCVANAAESLPQTPQPTTASAITLNQAIAAALANDPAFAAAVATSGSAQLDAAISRSSLLPSADAHGQYLFTQPNGLRNQAGQIGNQQAPRFIANNAIREYAAQILVNEAVSFAGVADYRRARALAVQSSADLKAPAATSSRASSLRTSQFFPRRIKLPSRSALWTKPKLS